jgi:hypothetical protein
MYATTTSILPHAPEKGNDPTMKFANALIKKVSKDKIERESVRHGKRARQSIIRMYKQTAPQSLEKSLVPTNRRYEQLKRNVRKNKF